MDKTTFKKLMNEFIALRKDEDNVDRAMRKFNPDFGYFSLGRYETLFLQAMKEAMTDTSDWISYFVYDMSFGKDAKEKSVTDKNGKGIPIKTLDNLYNIIKNNE
jgi:hypothetical protein